MYTTEDVRRCLRAVQGVAYGEPVPSAHGCGIHLPFFWGGGKLPPQPHQNFADEYSCAVMSCQCFRKISHDSEFLIHWVSNNGITSSHPAAFLPAADSDWLARVGKGSVESPGIPGFARFPCPLRPPLLGGGWRAVAYGSGFCLGGCNWVLAGVPIGGWDPRNTEHGTSRRRGAGHKVMNGPKAEASDFRKGIVVWWKPGKQTFLEVEPNSLPSKETGQSALAHHQCGYQQKAFGVVLRRRRFFSRRRSEPVHSVVL